MPASPQEPPAWWKEARFGVFVHWGVYAVPAGVHQGRARAGPSEWLMHSAKIPVTEYRTFAAGFTAAAFDAEAWVRAVRESGAGYLVVSAKHHDGFFLGASRASAWNAPEASAARRDLLRPLAEACRAAGLPLGFYYSQAQDWTNGGAAYGGHWDPAQAGDFDAYLDRVAIPQVRELLTAYGPGTPALLWWDTPAEMTPERAARIDAVVQELAPGLLQNDRLGGGFAGAFDTPEQRVPSRRPARAWETCMTMNESWGYNAGDDRWKAPETLLRQLASVAAQDGNYLLNLGPRPDGSIPGPSLERLRDIGRWMERHGAAVRGTRGGPFPHRLPWGDATRRGDDLFLLVDRWPEDGRLVVPLLDLPAAARLTEDSAPLPCRLVPGGIEITVPREAPDPAVSVVRLTFNGTPRLGAVPPLPKPPAVVQPVDGSLVLGAADCEIIGDHLALSSGQPPQLGCWTSLDSHPLWRVRLQRGGSFAVSLVYGVPGHRQGTLADVEIGAARLPFVAGGTGGWDEFVVAPVGTVELAAPGEIEVRVRPRNIPVGAVMNLREVRLVPL